ncbi:MAG: hypothetical protein HC921_09925 [Synechococcaceae cyanobacterium SM2_3_1]|nr:hypothetical protein [Synechococcaceae cyanobacterium SM2_3_1]
MGRRKAASYRNQIFYFQTTYETLQDAILACRRALDEGNMAILVESMHGYSIWSHQG